MFYITFNYIYIVYIYIYIVNLFKQKEIPVMVNSNLRVPFVIQESLFVI